MRGGGFLSKPLPPELPEKVKKKKRGSDRKQRKEKGGKPIVRLIVRVARWLRRSLAIMEREDQAPEGYKSKIWKLSEGDRVWTVGKALLGLDIWGKSNLRREA